MFRHSFVLAMLGVSLLAPAVGRAEDTHVHSAQDKPVLSLTPKLRAALRAEMAGLKAGVAELSVSLASGEWGKTAERAARIRDSYILKQKLSRAELEELEHSLPPDFVGMDEGFHRHADGLAEAARRWDHELAVFYFARMLEGCNSCHARYAVHTFPGYRRTEPAPPVH